MSIKYPPTAPQFLKRYLKFENIPKPKIAPFVHEKITIPNPSSFVQKINNLRYDFSEDFGNEHKSIEFISDFDYTITKYRHQNNYCDSLFGMWKKGQFLSKAFIQELSQTYKQFGPYQTDATISFQDRTFLVGQLYRSQMKSFQKHRITEQMVGKVISNANIVFRSHTVQFLQTLQHLNIPLYIISGGISDAIYNTLYALSSKNYTNISIHSNQFESYTFSLPDEMAQTEESKFVRFRANKPIHSYNKYTVMNHQKKRKNCFLMGDLVSDIYMAQGNNYENIISVFYGKEGQNDQRALAQNKFDIIVQGDCSHKIIIELLKVIYQRPGIDWEYLYKTDSNLHQLLI